MARFTDVCPGCKCEFENTHEQMLRYCSVGCQFESKNESEYERGYRAGIEAALTIMDSRAQALMNMGGVHVREAVGIGETALLIRSIPTDCANADSLPPKEKP